MIISHISHFVSKRLFVDDYNKISNLIEKSKPKIDNISDQMVFLLIVAEDKRFMCHKGFDIYAIIKAFFRYIVNGRISGASTIEQQLVRTITNERDRSIKRKVKEIILASAINGSFEKLIIAKTYLFLGYYGWRMTGYFNALKRLTEEQIVRTEEIPYAIIALLKYPLPKHPSKEKIGTIEKRIEYIKKRSQSTLGENNDDS